MAWTPSFTFLHFKQRAPVSHLYTEDSSKDSEASAGACLAATECKLPLPAPSKQTRVQSAADRELLTGNIADERSRVVGFSDPAPLQVAGHRTARALPSSVPPCNRSANTEDWLIRHSMLCKGCKGRSKHPAGSHLGSWWKLRTQSAWDFKP